VIKAARKEKKETIAYLAKLEKEWQQSLGQWQGKGGKSGKSGSGRSKGKSKGGKSKGKSSKGSSKGSGKGKGDRSKGKGVFGNLNMAEISKMSKEQAQAVLAQYAIGPSGKKPKKQADPNKWTQDVNSPEFRKWQSEQQKTTLNSRRSSASSLVTKVVKGVAKVSGVLTATT